MRESGNMKRGQERLSRTETFCTDHALFCKLYFGDRRFGEEDVELLFAKSSSKMWEHSLFSSAASSLLK